MGNIFERLGNVHEARRIIQQSERDAWKEVEDTYPWAEVYREGIGEALKEHRQKLLELQDGGIFEMLRDATGGVSLEIIAEPEKGKSGVNVTGSEGKNLGVYGTGWSIDVSRPCLERTLTDSGEKQYTWNTDPSILVGQGIIDGKIFSPQNAQYVTLSYSGGALTIQGESTTFQGEIPTNGAGLEILEDGFVNAFAFPKVVMPQERLIQSR